MAETEDYIYLGVQHFHVSFMYGALSKKYIGDHMTSH